MTSTSNRPRFFDTGTGPADVGLEDDRPLSDIVRDLSTHAQQLVRAEIDLAKSELTTRMKAMAIYIAMAAVGGVLALASLIYLGHAVAQLLDLVMPEGIAYLVTFALMMAAAAALALVAKAGFEKTSVAPTNSIEHAKEDLTWVKRHM